MKRILAFFLMFVVFIAGVKVNAQAITPELLSNSYETWYSEELGGTLVRSFDDNVVTVKWIPISGESDAITITNLNADVSRLVSKSAITDFATMKNPSLLTPSASNSVRWGSWQSFSTQVNTGGLPVALVAGVIAAVAPGIPLKVIASAIATVAGYSSYYTISGKIRYGSDNKYQYYERYTTILDQNGNSFGIKNFYDSGKTRLR